MAAKTANPAIAVICHPVIPLLIDKPPTEVLPVCDVATAGGFGADIDPAAPLAALASNGARKAAIRISAENNTRRR